MKKFLAMTLVVMMTVASGFAQVTKKTTAMASQSFVNKTGVQKAASGIKLISALPPVAGYLPMYTDATGTTGNSSVFQAANGNVGIGTSTPNALLHGISANGVSDFRFNTGAAGLTPTMSILNTNPGGKAGAFIAGTNGAGFAFDGSGYFTILSETHANIANNNAGQGPSLFTILSNGNTGIGTTTPANLLTVTGKIQSTTGGYVFPDSTLQTTAAVSSSLPSTDGSILVGGTAAAPALAVNTALIQTRVSGTCAAGSAMTGVGSTGTVSCGTIGAGGSLASVPVVVAQTSLSGASGLGASTPIYTATADGFYRVSVYMNSPAGGTCTSAPCSGEQIVLQWNDGVSTVAQGTTTCSLAGSCSVTFVAPIWVANSTSITAYGQVTGTGSVPTGTYNAHILVEKLM